MSDVRIIPCLDVKKGRVAKGVGFANLRDACDLVEGALACCREKADGLVLCQRNKVVKL